MAEGSVSLALLDYVTPLRKFRRRGDQFYPQFYEVTEKFSHYWAPASTNGNCLSGFGFI